MWCGGGGGGGHAMRWGEGAGEVCGGACYEVEGGGRGEEGGGGGRGGGGA